MAAADIIRIRDDITGHTFPFTVRPTGWGKFIFHGVLDWQLVRLESVSVSSIPDGAGVYTLLVQPGIANHPACSYLFYVGKADSLRQRFNDYLTKERSPKARRPHMRDFLNRYDTYIWFCFSALKGTLIGTAEQALMDAYLPPLSRRGYSAAVSAVRRSAFG